MLTTIFVTIIGALVFLFLFWKKLREDYLSNQIFTTGFYTLIGIGVGYLLSLKVLPTGWFWFSSFGASLGILAGILIYRFRPFEIVESGVIALFPWLGFYYFQDTIKNLSVYSFLAFFAILCLITLYIYLDSHYRSFSWYLSGRVGFSGLFVLGTFLLLRTALAPFFPFVVSFLGKFDALISGILAFVCFILIFNLARKIE